MRLRDVAKMAVVLGAGALVALVASGSRTSAPPEVPWPSVPVEPPAACNAQSIATPIFEETQRERLGSRPERTDRSSGPPGSGAAGQPGRGGDTAGARGAPSTSDDWSEVPVGDGRNLGPYMSAFQSAFTGSLVSQGIRDNCKYEGIYRTPHARPTVLVLSVSTTPAGFRIEHAQLVFRANLDEFQQGCVTSWLTGAELEVPGVEAGRRYRFTYPMRIGDLDPRVARGSSAAGR